MQRATIQLSKSALFEVWEVPTKQRIITVMLLIKAATPSEIKASYQVNANRIARAGREAFEAMLTRKPTPPLPKP